MQGTASTLLDVLPDDYDVIDLVFGGANPNPARLDCPGRDVLAQLAGRSLPIEHAGYRHLAQCSPCYREFRAHAHSKGRLAQPEENVSARAVSFVRSSMHRASHRLRRRLTIG